jgi:hypothetical protein
VKGIISVIVMFFLGVQLHAEGYDSTFVLSVKQKYAIPEDVSNGDYVGFWKKTYTWKSKNSITYAIKTNFNSAFSINSTSGLITISNASKIKGKVVRKDTVINLIIRSTDSGLGYEDDTCEIRVKEASYCKFIDYTYAGTKVGTRTQPFNDVSNTTLTGGYAYFIKRGNTPANKKYTINGIKATEASPTIIGAYGTGNNPAFNGSGLSAADGLFYFLNTPATSEYVRIYNLDIKNYPAGALRIATRSRSFGVYNSYFEKNCRVLKDAGLADVYLYGADPDSLTNWKHELINLEASGSSCPILKTDASGVNAYNIKVTVSEGPCFRFAISYYSRLSHFEFSGGSRALQTRYPQVVITDGIITASADAGMFLVTDQIGKPEKLRINNVLFKGNENGITTYNVNINNTTIENCRFESNTNDGINFRNGGNGRVVQNCSFINNGNDGIELANSTQTTNNLGIYYNLFYGNKGKAINGASSSCGTNIKIYNNTIIGTVDLSGASSEIVRNNFYQSLSSAATSSNNIILSSINQAAYFSNPSQNQYHLIGTAINAIDNGYDVGIKYDCDKTPIYNKPDIGACEYVAQSQAAVNNAPVIQSQSFSVQKETFQNSIGTIVAIDADNGQELSYSIISGDDKGYFTLDPETGLLSANSTSFLAGGQSEFELTIQVTDNANEPLSSTSKVTIKFTGEIAASVNNAPSINDQILSVKEEEFTNNIVGQVEATDIDNGQELTYSIVSGNANNMFTIDPQTGEITSVSDQIFNSSALSYKLGIMVTDNGVDAKSATAEISIELVPQSATSTNPVEDIASLKVYPNPSRGDVNIEISNDESGINQSAKPTVIEIIDLSGKIVKSKTVENSGSMIEENFNLTDLPNGLYSIRMQLSDRITTKKLILSK